MDDTDRDEDRGPGHELPAIRVIQRIADMGPALGSAGRGDGQGGTKRRPTLRRTLSTRGHEHGVGFGPKTVEREARILAHMARVQAELAALGEVTDA